ncbi:MAG TPA: glycosyltransferase family 2 protein [Rhodothermales bacterium]
MRVVAIIPAFNEQDAIGRVIADVPADLVDEIVVVDNASTDATASVARAAGATVVTEPRRGYGSACLRGIAHISANPPDVVVFLDGDYSDHPEEMHRLLHPILDGTHDFVIGSRMMGPRERGAMPPQAIIGNRLACGLMRLLWSAQYTDLGPFRAIRFDRLRDLAMEDTNYGWTIEMQIKAARMGLRYLEVPVSYRRRIGQSKISGTISGTVRASMKILWTIARYGLGRPQRMGIFI